MHTCNMFSAIDCADLYNHDNTGQWYDADAHGVKPAFAFGSGLSYTNFSYSSLSVNGRTVSFMLTNTGKRAVSVY